MIAFGAATAAWMCEWSFARDSWVAESFVGGDGFEEGAN